MHAQLGVPRATELAPNLPYAQLMTVPRSALAVIAVFALAGCSFGYHGPPPPDPTPAHGVPAPTNGPLAVGVAYQLTVYCPIDVAVGDAFWRFESGSTWPPEIQVTINGTTYASSPYAVPGTFTLMSPTTAVFKADVDGSILLMTRTTNPVEAACL